ncbi:hypothetical protein ACROYT_G019168 [Oculina patagonica]
MKVQAVVVLAALLLLATLVIESDCWHGPYKPGKRELEGKRLQLKRTAKTICEVAKSAGCWGMGKMVFEEDKGKEDKK